MAQIYVAPNGFEAPSLDFKEMHTYNTRWEKYQERLRQWCLNRMKGIENPHVMNSEEYIGKVIQFPAADGYALYMVASVSPPQLIHLDYLDRYTSETAQYLKGKDIIKKVDQAKKIAKLFA